MPSPFFGPTNFVIFTEEVNQQKETTFPILFIYKLAGNFLSMIVFFLIEKAAEKKNNFYFLSA